MKKNKSMPVFPCSMCGACCNNIGQVVEMLNSPEGNGTNNKDNLFYFPYNCDDQGRCEKLSDDNKCTIYETRPIMCNIQALAVSMKIPIIEFYNLNIHACNKLMDASNIPESFRIPLIKPRATVKKAK